MVTRLQLCLIKLVSKGLLDRDVPEADLAAAVGITTEHLSMILDGRATGSLIVWDKLLWHLMIPLSELKRGLDEDPPSGRLR